MQSSLRPSFSSPLPLQLLFLWPANSCLTFKVKLCHYLLESKVRAPQCIFLAHSVLPVTLALHAVFLWAASLCYRMGLGVLWGRGPFFFGFLSLVRNVRLILEEEMATYSSILAWKNSMDRGAWWAVVHGVAKSRILLSTHTHMHQTNNPRAQ